MAGYSSKIRCWDEPDGPRKPSLPTANKGDTSMRLIRICPGLVALGVFACSAILLPNDVAAAPNTPQLTDAQHMRLAELAGRWNVTQSEWKSAGEPPVIDHGSATLTLVLGRHIRQTLQINSAKAFEGLGYIGYDLATGKYFSTWMDVNFTGVIVATGDRDPASGAYTFLAQVPDGKGGHLRVRERMVVKDRDHFTFEYYEAHDASEALAIRLEYVRAD
jgi:hypothetical protein